MERGVTEADVEGGGCTARDETGEVEEGGEEGFVACLFGSFVFLVSRRWSQGGEDEEDGAGEEELDNHVERGGEQREMEVEVFRGEHPFVVLW